MTLTFLIGRVSGGLEGAARRPGRRIGRWMCALGVGTQLRIGHMAAWAAGLAGLAGKIVVFPTLDTGTLMPLLLPRITAIRDGPKRRVAFRGRKCHC